MNVRSPTSEIQIVLCGPKSSGKTVLLTAIFGCGFNIKTANDRTTQILQSDWKRLESGQSWPGATELGVRELAFTYNDRDLKVGLKINDYDGQLSEVLSLSAPDADLEANLAVFREMVRSASGLIFLFPYGEQTDDMRMRKFRDEINTFLSLVEEGSVNREALSLPVALVVNKWDRSPHYGHPDERALAAQFLESTPIYRDAVKRLQAFLPNTTIIPVAVVRPSGDARNTPDEIAPHNLLEPIRYVIEFVFERFEAEYRAIPDDTTPDDDKARYILMSGYFKEIRNYKDYGQRFEATEARIAARFEAEFASLGPRDIDTRMAEESWFFGAVSSTPLQGRFQKLQAGSLAEQFDHGLERASKSGVVEIDSWRQENAWLFERLADNPEFMARFDAARGRLLKAESAKRIRKWAAVAAAVPVALFVAWTVYANFDEGSRYKIASAVDVNAASLTSSCHLTQDYLTAYGPGKFHPPLLMVDGNRRKVRALNEDIQARLAGQIFGAVDELGKGAATYAEADARLVALAPVNACLDPDTVVGGRSPTSVFEKARNDLVAGRRFMAEEWSAVRNKLAPDGCTDIKRAHAKAQEFQGLYNEVSVARADLNGRFAVCDDNEKCNAFMSELDRATDHAAFNTLFTSDPRRQQCIADAQRRYISADDMFAEKRDAVFERIDRSLAAKLKTTYLTESELQTGSDALSAMSSDVPQTAGIYRPYYRPSDIDRAVREASSALSFYSGLDSVPIRLIEFRTNAGQFDSDGNPIGFDCNAAFYTSPANEAYIQFSTIRFFTSNCTGSGSNSVARYELSNTTLGPGTKMVRIEKTDRNRTTYPENVEVTRDDLFRLHSEGVLRLKVPGTAYTLTLHAN